MIEIIFLAVITGILIFKLITELGKRREDDPAASVSLLDVMKKTKPLPDDNKMGEAKTMETKKEEPKASGFFVPLRVHEDKEVKEKSLPAKLLKKKDKPMEENSQDGRWQKAWQGITAIKSHDPDFLIADFLPAANEAFEKIIETYVMGDMMGDDKKTDKKDDKKTTQEILTDYLAPDILADFVTAIEERARLGYRQESKNLIGIRDTKILDAAVIDDIGKNVPKKLSSANMIFRIKVQFESDQIYALYDKDHGLVEGDPARIIPKKDIWVFDRYVMGHDNDGRRWFLSSAEAA